MHSLFGSPWIPRIAALAACLPVLLAASTDGSAAPSPPLVFRVYSDYV